MRRKRERGATMVEMTMVGIPLIFMLLAIFEMSRGMWMYHTLSYAVKNGVRFAIVHGIDCVNTPDIVNNCSQTIGNIASVIANAAVGIDPTGTELIFTSSDGTTTSCYMGSTSTTPVSGPYGSLDGCQGISTVWPLNDGVNDLVGKPIKIQIKTPFKSGMVMFWPGKKPVSIAVVNFYASSLDYIQF